MEAALEDLMGFFTGETRDDVTVCSFDSIYANMPSSGIILVFGGQSEDQLHELTTLVKKAFERLEGTFEHTHIPVVMRHVPSNAPQGVDKNNRLGRRISVNNAFECPITRDRMQDPVMASDGYSYERIAIEKWLKCSNRSPITREALTTVLLPNRALKDTMDALDKDFLQQQQFAINN